MIASSLVNIILQDAMSYYNVNAPPEALVSRIL
jgi:hypothetical protein